MKFLTEVSKKLSRTWIRNTIRMDAARRDSHAREGLGKQVVVAAGTPPPPRSSTPVPRIHAPRYQVLPRRDERADNSVGRFLTSSHTKGLLTQLPHISGYKRNEKIQYNQVLLADSEYRVSAVWTLNDLLLCQVKWSTVYTHAGIKCPKYRQPAQRFLLFKLDLRKHCAGFIDLWHFILGGV
jgi:hypothetical protein